MYVLCFTNVKISGERLQDQWSSGLEILRTSTYLMDIPLICDKCDKCLMDLTLYSKSLMMIFADIKGNEHYTSKVMRKSAFCICVNMGTDQLRKNDSEGCGFIPHAGHFFSFSLTPHPFNNAL